MSIVYTELPLIIWPQQDKEIDIESQRQVRTSLQEKFLSSDSLKLYGGWNVIKMALLAGGTYYIYI